MKIKSLISPQIHKNIKNEYTQMKNLILCLQQWETEFMRQKQENLWSFYGSYNKTNRQKVESQTNQLLVTGYRLQRQLLIVKTDYLSILRLAGTYTYTNPKTEAHKKGSTNWEYDLISLQHKLPIADEKTTSLQKEIPQMSKVLQE